VFIFLYLVFVFYTLFVFFIIKWLYLPCKLTCHCICQHTVAMCCVRLTHINKKLLTYLYFEIFKVIFHQ